MNLEFKIYQLKETARMYKRLVEDKKCKNEFIIVGEELVSKKIDCFKVHQLEENGICLIGGLHIDEIAINIKKSDLILKSDGLGYETTEMNIPREYLTMEIIENIQRLNK